MRISSMINIYQPSLGEEELNAIKEVFESNWLGKGKKTEEFTELMSKKIDVSRGNVETVNSCTEGLFQIMRLLNLEKDDEVIIPSIHFIGAVNAIESVGCKPVFCDVDERTLNPNVNHIKDKITDRTKAIMILHYGGNPCDMDGIVEICTNNELKLIEDNANSPFSKYKGINTGTIGDFGAWSFDSMKQVVMGDGGLVYIKDKTLVQKFIYETYLGLKSSSGFSNSIDTKWWEFDIDCPARRSIINDIQGAMGVEQLKKIDGFISRRKEIHDTYSEQLNDLEWLTLPKDINGDCESSYYMYHVQTDTRDRFAKYLKDNGVYTTFRYYPLHLVEYYRDDYVILPNTEQLSKTTLCIPLHQSLSDTDVEYVIKTIRNYK